MSGEKVEVLRVFVLHNLESGEPKHVIEGLDHLLDAVKCELDTLVETGDELNITVDYMTREALDALPEV